MDVSGKVLYDKVRNLRSELSNVVTPEILDKICDKPSLQPFLKWFCENVNNVNVLSNEDVQIKNKLQEMNEWVEGSELDHALEENTKDYPDLLKIIFFDDTNINDLFAEYEIVKNSYKEDKDYIYTLQNGIKNLKKLEIELDETIEKEEESLGRENIKANRAYEECSLIMKKFDTQNHQFFEEVEFLVNVYADAAENKGRPLLWTQMPLKLFTKTIELYNHYLDVHIKRQFGNTSEEEQKTDSNYVSLINSNKEKTMDNEEKLLELTLCKTNLTNAKIEEILAKVQEESYIAMLNYIEDIYNLGDMKVPKHSELRTEILKVTRKRDFLEENITLLQERQLTEVVQQFSELQITKILKQDAHTRLIRTKNHLEKLRYLRFLAREHGHVHTDLLRMLMEVQFQCLKNVSEFVADAYHYFTTEYSLSSTRCESMQKLQNKYSAIVSSPKIHNSFHKFFLSMVCSDNSTHQLNCALQKYNDLIDENKIKKKNLLKTYLNSKVDKLEILENEINLQYSNEVEKGPTHTYKPVSYDIEINHSEALNNIQKIQNDLTKIRNQMKERLKADTNLEREKAILWQRFLIDPDTLRKIYKQLKTVTKKSCFDDALKKELNDSL
ncbi:HAUS augmin-like complex subunit 3 isoform X1 [Bombus terrestris]|uniref:HAUS augmin-like complex subunit 3 isoform X1 n=2 Tax=Bombus terrestris TaxID=30195 RepID=A0A9B2JMC4_BOMTE|nr:HAUS augmin-like complex subunit 3 isoform X1 [Bombus terrestris]